MPLTWTEWRTAYVRGTPYPGDTVTVTLQFSDTEVTYSFPDLILTILQPGDEITMVECLACIWYTFYKTRR